MSKPTRRDEGAGCKAEEGGHRSEVESSFLSPGYRASCACGWRDDAVFTESVYAEQAIARHLDAVGGGVR